MRELYREVGNPGSKEDIGEDGFVNAYHGSLVFKILVTYSQNVDTHPMTSKNTLEESSSKDYDRMTLLRKKHERLSEQETVLNCNRPSSEGW